MPRWRGLFSGMWGGVFAFEGVLISRTESFVFVAASLSLLVNNVSRYVLLKSFCEV